MKGIVKGLGNVKFKGDVFMLAFVLKQHNVAASAPLAFALAHACARLLLPS